jgi:signal transduction histidine kinase
MEPDAGDSPDPTANDSAVQFECPDGHRKSSIDFDPSRLRVQHRARTTTQKPCCGGGSEETEPMSTLRPLRVLLLEDSPDDTRLILHDLRQAGFEPVEQRVETETDFLTHLEPAPDLILGDYRLPRFDALRALRLLQERDLDVPFIVVTGALDDQAAVKFLEHGACDYLLKDRLARLGQAVASALAHKQARDNARRTAAALERRTRELTRSRVELSQLASAASHDLQEPLRMISSFSRLLARHFGGQLNATADEFISYIGDGVVRMQALINDLLDYSRLGTRGEAFRATDCEAIVERALANLKTSIDETGTVVTHGPLPSFRADGTQMLQLFQNLIGNAIKYRGVAPPRIHRAAERQGKDWVFSIRYYGIGFDPKYAERIFTVVQRLHTPDQYPGTGIGLAICKKIVEGHDGRIWADMEPGQGSRLFFTIPASADAE